MTSATTPAPASAPAPLKQYEPFIYGTLGMIASHYPLAAAVGFVVYQTLSQTQILDKFRSGGGGSPRSSIITQESITQLAVRAGTVAALAAHYFNWEASDVAPDQCPLHEPGVWKTAAIFASQHFALLSFVGGAAGAAIETLVSGSSVRNAASLKVSLKALSIYQFAHNIPNLVQRAADTEPLERLVLCTLLIGWAGLYAYSCVMARFQFLRHVATYGLTIPDSAQLKAIEDLTKKEQGLQSKVQEIEKAKEEAIEAVRQGRPIPKSVQALASEKPSEKGDRGEWISEIIKTAQTNIDSDKFVSGTSIQKSNYDKNATRTVIEAWLPEKLTPAQKLEIMKSLKF